MTSASLFELFFDSQKSIPCRKLYLDVCKYEQTFSTKNLQSIKNIINYLNESLNHIERCDTGLLMLFQLVVKQCSKEVLIENASHWLQSLLKFIQLCEQLQKVTLVCEIICDMIPVFAEDLGLHRTFSMSLLRDVISTIISNKNKVQVGHISCLHQCLKYFPGPCSPSYVAIEKFVLCNLSNPHSEIVKASAQCLVLLPSLGGEKRQKHTVAWKEQVNKTFGSLRQVMKILCQRIALSDSVWLEKKGAKLCLSLPTLETPVEQIEQAVHHFSALCYCLQNFLSVSFPYTIRIPIDEFLGFIVTVLSITPDLITSQAVEDVLLTGVLPIIHCCTLDVFKALIVSCHHNLVPHAQLICQLLIKNLQWSQTCSKTYQERQPYKDFRIKIYEVLQIWVQMSRAASGLDLIEDQMVKYFVTDLTIPTNFIQLTKGTEKMGGTKKKGKQRKTTSSTTETVEKDHYRTDAALAIAALKALRTILYAAGDSLNGIFYQKMCSITVKLIQEIHKKTRMFPPPYDNAEYRQELYRLLLAIVLVVPNQNNSLITQAVVLFSSGSQDPSTQVSSFCHEAQTVCSNIIHPRYTSMNFDTKLETISLETACDIEVNSLDSPVVMPQIPHQENGVDERTSNKDFVNLFQTNNEHPKDMVGPLISSEFFQKFLDFLKTHSNLSSPNKTKSPSAGEFHQQFLHFVHEKPHSTSSQHHKAKEVNRIIENPSRKSPSVSPASSTTDNSLDAQHISQEEDYNHIGVPELQNLNSTSPEKDHLLQLSEDTQEIFKTPLNKIVAASTSSADQEPKRSNDEFSWFSAPSSSTITNDQMNEPSCSSENHLKRSSTTKCDEPPEKKLVTTAEEMLLSFVDSNPDKL